MKIWNNRINWAHKKAICGIKTIMGSWVLWPCKNNIYSVVRTVVWKQTEVQQQTEMPHMRSALPENDFNGVQSLYITIKYLLAGMAWHSIVQGRRCTAKYSPFPPLTSSQRVENQTKELYNSLPCRFHTGTTTSTGSGGACLRRTDSEWGSGRRWWRLFWLISRKIISHKSLVSLPWEIHCSEV